RPVRASLMDNAPANRIQQRCYRLWLADHGQGLQITAVGGERYLHAPAQISQPFTHGHPAQATLAFAGHQPANFEAPGVVDGGLDSQYAALFVVHFDRVLFDPVFDAHSFGSTLNVTADLPVEAPVRVPAQKTQHVPATPPLH